MVQFADRMEGVTGSAIRALFKLMADVDIISFGGGNPSRDSFPAQTIAELSRACQERDPMGLLQYGATDGYPALKRAYLEHMAVPKGVAAELNNVLVTTGSMQGLDLALKVLVNPGDAVLVESPTFLGALQAFAIAQAKCVPVEMDDEGAVMEDLERKMASHRPKLFYCIPTFQNPTGKTLGKARRERVAGLAREYGVIVVEDDPYCDLRYGGEAQPPIKSFDTDGRVIMLNSFSKIIAPGIRVGCAVADAAIIGKMTVCKQCTDTHTALLPQAIAAEFLSRGLLPGHLERIIPGYRAQLDAMLQGIREHFPADVKYTRPEGGLFLWAELPEGMEALPLFRRAVEREKVAFIPGEHFYVDGSGKNTMRLNFSSEPVARIQEGLKRLGRLIAEG